jgi:subfamily B ATP-binding cassette protein MsbA
MKVRFRSPGRRSEKAEEDAQVRLNRESLAVFRRILQYVKPYRGWFTVSLVTLLFSALLGLVLPLVVRSLVDVVLVEQNLDRLNTMAIGLFIVFIVQAVFSFGHRLSLAFVGERAVADIRIDVFRHLQQLSLRYFADNRTGEIISRLTNDISQLQSAVTENLMALLRQVVVLFGAAGLLFYLNWRLTLIILLGIPFMSLTMVFLGRRIRDAARRVQDALAEAANVAEETTTGVRIVKSFAREAYEVQRFTDKVNETFAAAMTRAKISAVLAPIIGFLAFGSITITLWVGSFQVIEGTLTAGGLVAYLIYTMMVAAPIASLAGLYSQFQSAIGATERVMTLLDQVPDIRDVEGAYPLERISGTVEFADVSFAYQSDTQILDAINFKAAPGEVVALVGPSGAGKSTLINLITRFYDAVSGSVEIDGHDVRAVQLHSLRDQIGIVPQETLLFSETVFENIRYGRLEADREAVEAAARAANAHDFIISELPDGYDTLVGERGVKLSGGQRQRVAIARALLKDPAILILDEATSSLDTESERLVQDALERLMAGRTTFVIAHRLSTIHSADQILVIDHGRLIASGAHQDLMQAQDGLYRRLYEMQFEQFKGTADMDRLPTAS